MNEVDRSNIYTALNNGLIKDTIFTEPLIRIEETRELFQQYLDDTKDITFNEARALVVLATMCRFKLVLNSQIVELAKKNPGRVLHTMFPQLDIIAYDSSDLLHQYDLWIARDLEGLPMDIEHVGPFILGIEQPIDSYIHEILFLTVLRREWRHYTLGKKCDTSPAIQTLYGITIGTSTLPYFMYDQVITRRNVISISNERNPFCVVLKYDLNTTSVTHKGVCYYKTDDMIVVFNGADVLIAYKDDGFKSKLTNSDALEKIIDISSDGEVTVKVVLT